MASRVRNQSDVKRRPVKTERVLFVIENCVRGSDEWKFNGFDVFSSEQEAEYRMDDCIREQQGRGLMLYRIVRYLPENATGERRD